MADILKSIMKKSCGEMSDPFLRSFYIPVRYTGAEIAIYLNPFGSYLSTISSR